MKEELFESQHQSVWYLLHVVKLRFLNLIESQGLKFGPQWMQRRAGSEAQISCLASLSLQILTTRCRPYRGLSIKLRNLCATAQQTEQNYPSKFPKHKQKIIQK